MSFLSENILFVTKAINKKNNCSRNKGKVAVNLLLAFQQSFLAYSYHLPQYTTFNINQTLINCII